MMKFPALLAAAAALAFAAGCSAPDQPAEGNDVTAASASSAPAPAQAPIATPAAPAPLAPAADLENGAGQASTRYAVQPFDQLGVVPCDRLAGDIKQCLDSLPESFERDSQRRAFARVVRKWQNQIKQGADQATMSQTCADFRNRVRDQLAKLGCVAI